MGSSKKSKDKDKNRDERKKRKHRSRSRSKDRESKRRHKHKKKSHRQDHSRSPVSDARSGLSDEGAQDNNKALHATPPPAPRISAALTPPVAEYRGDAQGTPDHHRGQKRKVDDSEDALRYKKTREEQPNEGWKEPEKEGAGLSLSVIETNKIRAKLGLKPLQVDDGRKAEKNSDDVESEHKKSSDGTKIIEDAHEFYHKPAQNLRDKLQVEKLREKIAVQREKRKQKKKLNKIKTLAGSDSEDDALSWVKKSRKISKEKEEAEKKAKQLEELDAQFGVGDLVEEEIKKDNRKAYSSNHLAGIKVQHHHSRFADGTTILTLADAEVLAEADDALENVNIIDDERAEKNVELKRKKDDAEYEAPEVDEFGNMVQKDVLSKYDEEIAGGGPKKSSFQIGRSGEALLDNEELSQLGERERKMARLRRLQTLTRDSGNQLASEYLTQEEAVVSFKKVKKGKKKKKKMLTADDLDPIDDGSVHHGSRGGKRDGMRGAEEEEGQQGGERVKSLRELMMEEEDEDNQKMEVDDNSADYEGLNDDDDLQEALSMSRKAKLAKQKQMKVEELKNMLHSSTRDEMSDTSKVSLSDLLPSTDGLLVTLNTTDEFCRTLGDIPTYGLSGNRAEEEQNTTLANAAANGADGNDEEEQPATGTWEEVGIEDTRVEIGESEAAPILDEEPDASVGVANALRLAIKKGYLEKEDNVKKSNAGLQHLRAINYSIDDKAGDDDRRRGRGDDRHSGPITDFKDKDGYKPSISLEYVDDEGRKLCPKEAFRYLSHKFHGRGSGKNKTEKRMKKWQEEQLMKKMSSGDTPLQTLERQMDKQKQLGTSYLLLSGNTKQEATATDGKIRK